MDTIDSNVMAAATIAVEDALADSGLEEVHTITVTLNGAHGGADVVIEGFSPYDETVNGYHTITITLVVH